MSSGSHLSASSRRQPVTIAGAGPAGLAAAITLARAGVPVVVHERSETTGHRFHGDFQGLENWTTGVDVLEELAGLGIEPDFPCTPIREAVLFDPDGREARITGHRPLFYLVRRGGAPDSLDTALARQAAGAGAELRLGSDCRHLPEGGIVATGPHRADAIAVGYTFLTDTADGVYAVLGDRYSAAAYGYLIIVDGHGTLATCLFRDFHDEALYLQRTVEFFTARVGVQMREARRFGGSGNFELPASACRGGILRVGEAAGFQDAFAGFGMRHALLSGHLAACAIVERDPTGYDHRWRERLGGQLAAGLVNRYLYELAGDGARRWLVRRLTASGDAPAWLYRRYNGSWFTPLLLPLARRSRRRRSATECVKAGCDCTWCRCARHSHHQTGSGTT